MPTGCYCSRRSEKRRWESNPRWRICNLTICPENNDFVVAASADASARDPELAKIIAAWPTLPEHLKRAMLAMLG
jgi:hypothetical protein